MIWKLGHVIFSILPLYFRKMTSQTVLLHHCVWMFIIKWVGSVWIYLFAVFFSEELDAPMMSWSNLNAVSDVGLQLAGRHLPPRSRSMLSLHGANRLSRCKVIVLRRKCCCDAASRHDCDSLCYQLRNRPFQCETAWSACQCRRQQNGRREDRHSNF